MLALRAGLDTDCCGPSASERSPTPRAGSPQQYTGPSFRRFECVPELTPRHADLKARTPIVTPATSELGRVSFHAAAAQAFYHV